MARDLYGEMLSRALQRQAPSGHFPAYITPNEAGLLRSRGGGVPPGGGQYMAGGIPSFQSSPEGDPPGGADMGDPEGTGVGTGAEGADPADSADMADVIAAMDVQPSDPHGHSFGTSAGQTDAEGLLDIDIGVAQDAIQGIVNDAQTNHHSRKGGTRSSQEQSAVNQENIDLALSYGLIDNAMAVEIAGQDIDQGGLGSLSPGGYAARPGNTETPPTFAQIVAINTEDPVTQDYAINNPNPQMGTPSFNLSLQASNAAQQVGFNNPMGDILGAVLSFAPAPIGPLVSALNIMTGRGTSALIGKAMSGMAKSDVPGISHGAQALLDVKGAVSDVIGEITSPVTDLFDEAVEGITTSPGAEAAKGALASALDIATGGITPTSNQEAQSVDESIGGELLIPTPAPVPEPVVSDENVFARSVPIPTTADIDIDTQNRILANVLSGLQRIERPTEGVTAFGPAFV